MALSANTALATYGQVPGQFLDLSDVLAELIRQDNTAFLSRVPMIGVATETQHSWVEDSLNGQTITSTEAMGSATTGSIVATMANYPWIVVGAVVRDQASAAVSMNELMQVTAVYAGSADVSRGYAGTAGTAHADNAIYQVVATPAQEDADMPSDISKARTKISNFVQVYLRGVKVSYSAQAILQAGVPSEFGHQTAARLKEIMREMDSSLVLGGANATTATGSSSQYRTMGGLLQFATGGSIGGIQVLSTGATNTTAENLTPDGLNTMASAIWYNGGMTAGPYRGFILTSGKQKRKIAAFDAAYRRMDYNSNRVGFTTEKFLSDLGYEFEVIVDPNVPDDVVVMGDLNRIKTMPLKGQSMRVEDIAKTGRALKAMVTGEYTAEFRNAPQTTAVHTNLS